MSDELNSAEDEIVFELYKRERRQKLYFIGGLLLFFVISFAILLPSYLSNRKETARRLTNAELDAARANLPPRDVKSLEAEVVPIGNSYTETLELASNTQSKVTPTPLSEFPPPPTVKEQAPKILLESPIQHKIDNLDTKAERIRKTIDGFLKATTPEEKCQYILRGKELLPKVTEYYQRNPEEVRVTIGGLINRNYFIIDGSEYAIEERLLGDGSENRTFLGLKQLPTGDFLIDWESMVGYSEMSCENLVKTQPTSPQLFRFYAIPFNFYNFDFSDRNEWQCFKLYNHTSMDSLYGYVKRDSDSGQRMIQAARTRSPITAIARISYPDNPRGKRLVRIDEFLQETWLIPQ